VIASSREIKALEITKAFFRKISRIVLLISIFMTVMIMPIMGARMSPKYGISCSDPSGSP
jgi:hypothetical protein